MKKILMSILVITLLGVFIYYFQSNNTKYLEENKIAKSKEQIEEISINDNSIINKNEESNAIKELDGKSEESDLDDSLLKDIKDYTYIEHKGIVTSASLSYGVSAGQSFDIKNIKEGTKSVIIGVTCYLDGEKNFATDMADILYTTDNIEAGFDFSFEDDSWNLNTRCGGGGLKVALGKEKKLFYEVIPEKIKLKENEPTIIGVMVADDDKNLFQVNLEDTEENIVKKFKNHRVVILKCMYTYE